MRLLSHFLMCALWMMSSGLVFSFSFFLFISFHFPFYFPSLYYCSTLCEYFYLYLPCFLLSFSLICCEILLSKRFFNFFTSCFYSNLKYFYGCNIFLFISLRVVMIFRFWSLYFLNWNMIHIPQNHHLKVENSTFVCLFTMLCKHH